MAAFLWLCVQSRGIPLFSAGWPCRGAPAAPPEPATHGAAVLDGTIPGVDHLHPKNRGIIQMKIPEGGAHKTVIEKVVPLYIPVGPSGCFRYGANVIPSHGPGFPTRAGST